jgi:S-adenosylmethionine synthetase
MTTITRGGGVHPDATAYDVAERKGIGHPDSLADLVADAFSRRYAAICMEMFGAIPNHWVDKVTLVGAAARVRYGGYSILKPVDCYLFGKITARVGSEDIDLAEMFRQVIHRTLPTALGGYGILPHLRTHVNNTSGSATDHDPEFYAPSSADALRHLLTYESVANDTVICTGASSHGLAARTAVWLETLINATDFRDRYPMVGSDVKVMVIRVGDAIDVTAAIPAHPQTVLSWEDYRDQLAYVDVALTGELKARMEGEGHVGAVRLHINTKDGGRGAYLAPFGTSLGKGDCGAVGRGNRGGGVIEPLRPSGCEAPAGKNPVHHVGKIYTALARQAAQLIHQELGHYTEVTVAARNGDPLDDPAFVFITLPDEARRPEQSRAGQIAAETLAAAPDFCTRFLETDPVTAFHRQVTGDPTRKTT